MAETGLSYEGDFAPLKQQYFQQVFADPRLNPRAAAALSSQFSAEADKAFAQRQELQDRASVTRSRELQFESAKFSLEREREKAARERNNLAELAPLIATFDAITKDPTTDYKTKSMLIGQAASQKSDVLSQNPAARIAYDATVRSLTPEVKPEQDFTLGSYILQGGDPSFLPAGLADQPTVALSPLTYASGIKKSKQAYGQSVAEGKASLAQTTRQQEQLDKAISAISKAVIKPNLTRGSEKATGATFEAPAVKGSFDYLINTYGTLEEQELAKKGDAAALVGIANVVIPRALQGAPTGTPAVGPSKGETTRSLYTTSK